jgi:transcriptional regulatory protein RtcR
MKRNVVIGLLGTNLDGAPVDSRWERWRPSVSLCQRPDFVVSRFELLHEAKYRPLAELVAADMKQVSPETEIQLRPVAFNDPWDFESVYGALHDYAAQQSFDVDAEDYLIHITTGTHVAQICLFLLAESGHLPGRLIQTSPPKLRDGPSLGGFSVIDLDLSKYDRLAARFQEEQQASTAFLKSGIETRNKVFNALIDEIEHVALHSKAPILLSGQTGAGKSQLARRIFELKKTRGQVAGRFVEVNCATLRGDGAMSALFGHLKGSFTGALTDRPGLLKAAHAGVLFLDEIGELGDDEQAMLLRALEEKRFLPVGADRDAESDFQLICGTNRDLKREAETGEFRPDLLARINLWNFRLPGLRERPEDIEPNIRYELDRMSPEIGHRVQFNKEALQAFLKFATSSDAKWSGNFRDLNGALTRMAILAQGKRINLGVFEAERSRLAEQWKDTVSQSGSDLELLSGIMGREGAEQVDRFDQAQLAAVIRTCRDSQSLSEAGRALFAVSRVQRKSTNDADRLKKYLTRFGLSWESVA